MFAFGVETVFVSDIVHSVYFAVFLVLVGECTVHFESRVFVVTFQLSFFVTVGAIAGFHPKEYK